uniref:Ribosomal_L11 domain-containing protein n=1 Tax=Macrostomum lignano TaxID=282301 RepID=A0A1I8F7Z6_9PLAT
MDKDGRFIKTGDSGTITTSLPGVRLQRLLAKRCAITKSFETTEQVRPSKRQQPQPCRPRLTRPLSTLFICARVGGEVGATASLAAENWAAWPVAKEGRRRHCQGYKGMEGLEGDGEAGHSEPRWPASVPTASALVIRALNEPPRDRKKVKHVKHTGNITFDEVVDIAKTMRPRSMAKTMAGTVKEILGTAQSVGCTRRWFESARYHRQNRVLRGFWLFTMTLADHRLYQAMLEATMLPVLLGCWPKRLSILVGAGVQLGCRRLSWSGSPASVSASSFSRLLETRALGGRQSVAAPPDRPARSSISGRPAPSVRPRSVLLGGVREGSAAPRRAHSSSWRRASTLRGANERGAAGHGLSTPARQSQPSAALYRILSSSTCSLQLPPSNPLASARRPSLHSHSDAAVTASAQPPGVSRLHVDAIPLAARPPPPPPPPAAALRRFRSIAVRPTRQSDSETVRASHRGQALSSADAADFARRSSFCGQHETVGMPRIRLAAGEAAVAVAAQ